MGCCCHVSHDIIANAADSWKWLDFFFKNVTLEFENQRLNIFISVNFLLTFIILWYCSWCVCVLRELSWRWVVSVICLVLACVSMDNQHTSQLVRQTTGDKWSKLHSNRKLPAYKPKAEAFIRELVTNGDLHDLSKIEREGVRQGMSLETLSFCLLSNLSIICEKRPLVPQERGKGNKLEEILHIPTREAKKNFKYIPMCRCYRRVLGCKFLVPSTPEVNKTQVGGKQLATTSRFQVTIVWCFVTEIRGGSKVCFL